MVNFFQAMAQALRDNRLPEGEELDVQASRRDDALGWYGLSPAAQQAMVQGVLNLFAPHTGVVVKYSPMLRSRDTYYRPLTCMPASVITTLLSGEQDLHSLDDSGSSCQWEHIFTEESGISHVTIIGLEELRRKRSRSRSRSRSASRSDAASRKRKRSPARVRPKYARQNAVGFFPFLLSSLAARFLDLDFAQIYAHEMSQYKSKQCLISSLEYYGVDTGVLSHIARQFQNFAIHVPKKCFKAVAEQCKVSLNVTYYRNDIDHGTMTYKAHVEGGRPLALAVLHDHIFPDIQINCSLFFIRNMARIAALVDEGKIPEDKVFHVTKITPSRIRYSPEAQTMKASAAVKALRKAGHFEKGVSAAMRIEAAAAQSDKGDVKLEPAHFDKGQREWEYRPVGSRDAQHSDVEEEADDIEYKGAFATQRDNSYIYFAADFEAYVQGEAHEACMGGLMELDLEAKSVDEDPAHVHLFEGKDVVRLLFSQVRTLILARERKLGHKLTHKVVYFHNLKYDRTLFEKDPNVRIVGVCDKDNAVYSIKVRFMGCHFQIRDSYKLIPEPLRKFASAYSLPASLQKKEFSVYTFFAPENARADFTCSPRQYVSSRVFDGDGEKDDAMRQDYLDKLTLHLQTLRDTPIVCSGACCADGKFHPWLLYQDYLKYDVLVLAAGLLTFRREMLHITDNELDPLQSLTLASFANRYMGHNGSFDGMYELSGELRAYQGQAVAGGRVFVSPSAEGKHLHGKFAYLDAVSLYPSAILYVCEKLGGYPTGPCEMLSPEQLNYDFLRTQTTEFTVTIEITAIGKKQRDIPFIKVQLKDSIDYVNELPDGKPIKVTVDRVTLEDWIEFHQITFTVLQGMYWSGPRNTTFGTIQRKIFDGRLASKAAGEVARAGIYKLIGNSAYGKTIQKTAPTDKLMIECISDRERDREQTETNYHLTLHNNLHLIKSFRFVGDHQIEATRYKVDDSFTLAHIGSQVLAASKRLMNRVFNLASDMGLNLYYTDTDSFVCDHGAVPRLAAAFAVRYGFPLLGKDMMQFHSDFTFKLPNGKTLDAERVYSTNFWPIGKKLYCHELEGETEEGETVKSIQFKCKGCTHEGLLYKAREYGPTENEGVFGLYMNLSMGESIEVPLNPPGATRFVYDKDNRVSTHGKIFYRSIRSKAAQARVKAERKAAAEHLAANPPVYDCAECEYERVTGDIQSQHKHTCHADPSLLQEDVEDVFFDRPDSTIDSWRSKPAALPSPAPVADASPPWPEDVFDPHYDSLWQWYEQEGDGEFGRSTGGGFCI